MCWTNEAGWEGDCGSGSGALPCHSHKPDPRFPSLDDVVSDNIACPPKSRNAAAIDKLTRCVPFRGRRSRSMRPQPPRSLPRARATRARSRSNVLRCPVDYRGYAQQAIRLAACGGLRNERCAIELCRPPTPQSRSAEPAHRRIGLGQHFFDARRPPLALHKDAGSYYRREQL